MKKDNSGKTWVIGLVVALTACAAWSAERTWTDASGKFSVTAEYITAQDGRVILRKVGGKQISVPLKRLSEADREFVATQVKRARGKQAAAREADPQRGRERLQREVVMEIAQAFFSDLRTRERAAAGRLLTDEAQAVIKTKKSALAYLPTPDPGNRAIRVGRPKFDGTVSEVPVLVEAGDRLHQTWLHLRLADGRGGQDWRIFALSAVYPDGQKSLDFEASVATAPEEDPRKKLLGKPFLLEGYTIDGQPVNSAEYKGKVVLIDFWATWCGPCKAEMPNILTNWMRFHDVGFEVMAVSIDTDLEALAAFTLETNPPWTVVADRHPNNKKSMASKYGIRAYPTLILLGPDGRVASIDCRGKRLGEEVARLLRGN